MCMGVGLPLACHIWLFLGANSKNIVEYYLNMRKTVSFRSPKTGAGKKVTFGVLNVKGKGDGCVQGGEGMHKVDPDLVAFRSHCILANGRLVPHVVCFAPSASQLAQAAPA